MNYIDWLNQSLGMPEEAAALCREHCPKVAATKKYADLKRRFFAGEDTAEDVRAFAEEYGLHPYAMQLVLDELYSAQTRAMYAEHGWDEEIFLDSVRDFAIRTKECIRDFGIVGFTAYNWVSDQLRCDMFRLGRFQFHLQTYSGEDYSAGGYTIRKGETAINIHIPAGEPISREVRLDSYRRAFRFFGGKYHAFTCSSYLFYEKHYEMLPKNSNILDFMGDFYLYDFGERKCENVLWRIFHHRDSYDPATLPRDTSLRKAYAEHLEKNGMVVGGASGVFLFDGNGILRPVECGEVPANGILAMEHHA